MIYIKSSTPVQAWRDSCLELYDKGIAIPENGFYKNDSAVIEILDVMHNLYDHDFPMAEQDIQIINNYLVSGEQEDRVIHDWTKIYRKRLFDDNQQIGKVIEYLSNKPEGLRAQASIWNGEIDFDSTIAPCLQILWFKIVNGKLEIHVHMRATDCYGKLLMNINEFIALQKFVSQKLQVAPGKYIHFVDSLHFHEPDHDTINVWIDSIKLT